MTRRPAARHGQKRCLRRAKREKTTRRKQVCDASSLMLPRLAKKGMASAGRCSVGCDGFSDAGSTGCGGPTDAIRLDTSIFQSPSRWFSACRVIFSAGHWMLFDLWRQFFGHSVDGFLWTVPRLGLCRCSSAMSGETVGEARRRTPHACVSAPSRAFRGVPTRVNSRTSASSATGAVCESRFLGRCRPAHRSGCPAGRRAGTPVPRSCRGSHGRTCIHRCSPTAS